MAKKKSILFIETKNAVYGGQKALLARCGELDRLGISYLIIHPYASSEFLRQYKEKSLAGRIFRPKKNFINNIEIFRILFIVDYIIKITRNFPIEVIHLEAFDSAYIVAILKKLHFLPQLLTVFGISSERYFRFNKIDRVLLRWLDRYATNSEFSKSMIAQNGGINASDISVCYSPIAFSALEQYLTIEVKNLSSSRRYGQAIIGYVGSFDQRKRLDRFVDFCAALKIKRPNCALRFKIYGSPKNSQQKRFLETVKKQIARAHLENTFIFHSYASIDSIAGAIDVLFCPYENEPFGRVVPEFLFMGVPVVITNDGGLPEAGCGEATMLEGATEADMRTDFVTKMEQWLDGTLTSPEPAKLRSKLIDMFGVKTVVERELTVYGTLGYFDEKKAL
jgi:glycosyltransferase involved in cell wall biosynthesis